MEKVFVAQRVAKKIWEAEAQIDEAIREATELLADVLKAPVDMGVSPIVVDESQAKIMESLVALSTARTAMVAAHAELNKAKLRVGIRHKALFTPSLAIEEAIRMEAEEDLRKVG